jgi:hypothetical protein
MEAVRVEVFFNKEAIWHYIEMLLRIIKRSP